MLCKVVNMYGAPENMSSQELYSVMVQRGSLKRSARAVQLFGRLAVLETHTL